MVDLKKFRIGGGGGGDRDTRHKSKDFGKILKVEFGITTYRILKEVKSTNKPKVTEFVSGLHFLSNRVRDNQASIARRLTVTPWSHRLLVTSDRIFCFFFFGGGTGASGFEKLINLEV